MKVKEKEIHKIFTVPRMSGVDRVYGHHDYKSASIQSGGRFMDFSKTETIISLN